MRWVLLITSIFFIAGATVNSETLSVVLLVIGCVFFLFASLPIALNNSYGEIRTDGTGCPCCGRDPKKCGYADWEALTPEQKEQRKKDQEEHIKNVISSIG